MPTALKHDVFHAIADPTRRELVRLLVDKEEPVVSISGHFPISRTAINKHLAILQDAGLVTNQKVGRETRYRAHLEPLAEVEDWLAYLEQFWGARLSALKRYVEIDGAGETPVRLKERSL